MRFWVDKKLGLSFVFTMIFTVFFSAVNFNISLADSSSPTKGWLMDSKAIPLKAGDEWTNNLGIKFVWVPAGSFLMGSPDSETGRRDEEGPQHEVTFSKGFWIGKYEITQNQWKSVTRRNPSISKGEEKPVSMVSHDDCLEFIKILNSMDNANTYALPSEAQWEYSCRAGTKGSYPGKLDAIGWYKDNSRNYTNPVGLKKSNLWGIHDMVGNVMEWCEDKMHDSYINAPSDGSAWTEDARDSRMVCRGSSSNAIAVSCRSAARSGIPASLCLGNVGLRLVRTEGKSSPVTSQLSDRDSALLNPEFAIKPKPETIKAKKVIRGKSFVNSLNIKLVWIHPGTFEMGSTAAVAGEWKRERPKHKVTFNEGFWLSECEVTQRQWIALMGKNPSTYKGPNMPVEKVTYDDCQEFIWKLNDREGVTTYGLPSESQWEYACRAGTTTPHMPDLDSMAWYQGNSGGHKQEVRLKKPNAWGLYDMIGNVFEWCEDKYNNNYLGKPDRYLDSPDSDNQYPIGAPVDGSPWLVETDKYIDRSGKDYSPGHIIRGGFWYSDIDSCRPSFRFFMRQDDRNSHLGLRLMYKK